MSGGRHRVRTPAKRDTIPAGRADLKRRTAGLREYHPSAYMERGFAAARPRPIHWHLLHCGACLR
ncbi:hypothetical protein [Azospirillum palustre]